MRVICIDDDWETLVGYCSAPFIKFGEIVTVSSAFKDHEGLWYTFFEYGDNTYEQCGFAPLSDINEQDFQRNYQVKEVLK